MQKITCKMLLDKCKEILYRTKEGTCVNEEDFSFLMSILPFHYEWNEWVEKDGYPIKIYVDHRHAYGTIGFQIQYKDGSVNDFSFHKCIYKDMLEKYKGI